MNKLYKSLMNSVIDDEKSLKELTKLLLFFTILPFIFLFINIELYPITIVVELQVLLLLLIVRLKYREVKSNER